MDTSDLRIGISELCSAAGVMPRTVRYYIAEGLLDRPEGSNKGAYYTMEHLVRLRKIRNMREKGIPLDVIRERFSALDESTHFRHRTAGTTSILTHVTLDEGVELIIDPVRSKLSASKIKQLHQAVHQAYEQITKNSN